jgi:hypothetical protein
MARGGLRRCRAGSTLAPRRRPAQGEGSHTLCAACEAPSAAPRPTRTARRAAQSTVAMARWRKTRLRRASGIHNGGTMWLKSLGELLTRAWRPGGCNKPGLRATDCARIAPWSQASLDGVNARESHAPVKQCRHMGPEVSGSAQARLGWCAGPIWQWLARVGGVRASRTEPMSQRQVYKRERILARGRNGEWAGQKAIGLRGRWGREDEWAER